MLHKSARFILAAILALSLVPAVAFAANDDASSGNPIVDLFYTVVGYESGDNVQLASAGLYPNELTPPPTNSELSKIVPELAGSEELLNGGILLGSGGKLYYMREVAFKNGSGQTVSGYRTLECFQDGAWTTLATLPDWLQFCSATVFGATDYSEGEIILVGAPMGSDGSLPAITSNPESHVYTFDPNSEAPSWQEIPAQGVPVATSVVNNGKVLQMVGGIQNGSPTDAVLTFDISTGAVTEAGHLSSPVVGAQTVPYDNGLYIYSYADSLNDLRNGTGTPKVTIYREGVSDLNSSPITSGVTEPANIADYPSRKAVLSGALSQADEGLILVGPQSSGSTISDTYVGAWGNIDGSVSPYSQTLSDEPVSGAAATVYAGNLYGLGSVLGSDGTTSMVFRSTVMPDASCLVGSGGVWRKDSQTGLEFIFSPDYSRFKYKVTVDGNDLIWGQDYDSRAGTTIIDLRPGFLQTLSEGPHTMTAFFDDGLTEVSANFTVQQAASVIPDGYTRPAALASTGDTLPLVPLACMAVAAVALGAVAFKRRSAR